MKKKLSARKRNPYNPCRRTPLFLPPPTYPYPCPWPSSLRAAAAPTGPGETVRATRRGEVANDQGSQGERPVEAGKIRGGDSGLSRSAGELLRCSAEYCNPPLFFFVTTVRLRTVLGDELRSGLEWFVDVRSRESVTLCSTTRHRNAQMTLTLPILSPKRESSH